MHMLEAPRAKDTKEAARASARCSAEWLMWGASSARTIHIFSPEMAEAKTLIKRALTSP